MHPSSSLMLRRKQQAQLRGLESLAQKLFRVLKHFKEAKVEC